MPRPPPVTELTGMEVTSVGEPSAQQVVGATWQPVAEVAPEPSLESSSREIYYMSLVATLWASRSASTAIAAIIVWYVDVGGVFPTRYYLYLDRFLLFLDRAPIIRHFGCFRTH